MNEVELLRIQIEEAFENPKNERRFSQRPLDTEKLKKILLEIIKKL
jgi:hypothetical protein